MRRFMVSRRCAAAAVMLACLAGCGGSDGPELAEVYGYVKLDGQPLPGATVEFQPEQGSPSLGETDEEGYYTLKYTFDTDGAMVGRHTVKITTYRESVADAQGNEKTIPEKVPNVYNVNTTLSEEVASGSQEIDFDLKSSEGKVVQPRPGQ